MKITIYPFLVNLFTNSISKIVRNERLKGLKLIIISKIVHNERLKGVKLIIS